jgi:hypothetical protein
LSLWSRAAAGYWDDDIIWAAHGTSARSAQRMPYQRRGWKKALTDVSTPLDAEVTYEEIQSQADNILAAESSLKQAFGEPLYLAFNRYRDGVRASQGYLGKLPVSVIELFPALIAARRLAQSLRPTSNDASPGVERSIGRQYREANEMFTTSSREPMVPDPAAIDRGNQAHPKIQNALARYVKALGWPVFSADVGDPDYDLVWLKADVLYLAEVKSLTTANEEGQLRLALGQVLRYAAQLRRAGRSVKAVIVTEREPSDQSWRALCSAHGVTLTWPGNFELLGRAE